MKRTLIFFIFIISVSQIFSIDFTADYIDGFLDVKENGSWSEVYIGDTLSGNVLVRLDEGSYAEFSYGRGNIIKLTRPGTYQLAKLVDSKREVSESGVAAIFSNKFKTLLKDDKTKTQTTIGGVRAAEAENISVEWMSGGTSELILDGRNALEERNFKKAEEFFKDAYELAADDYEENDALFFLGLTAAMKGNYSDALSHLDNAFFESDFEFYTDYYMLKGQLLIESFAYNEAFEFLNGYNFDLENITDEKLQEIYFMQAVAGNNSGKVSDAKILINKLLKIDPYSDIAKSAREYRSKI